MKLFSVSIFNRSLANLFDAINAEIVFEISLPDVTHTYWYVFSYYIFMALSSDIDKTTFYISGYKFVYILALMFIYRSTFLLLRTTNLWFERMATFVFVVFNLKVKPIRATITLLEITIHFIWSI